jgi:hypothetical protein
LRADFKAMVSGCTCEVSEDTPYRYMAGFPIEQARQVVTWLKQRGVDMDSTVRTKDKT